VRGEVGDDRRAHFSPETGRGHWFGEKTEVLWWPLWRRRQNQGQKPSDSCDILMLRRYALCVTAVFRTANI